MIKILPDSRSIVSIDHTISFIKFIYLKIIVRGAFSAMDFFANKKIVNILILIFIKVMD